MILNWNSKDHLRDHISNMNEIYYCYDNDVLLSLRTLVNVYNDIKPEEQEQKIDNRC